MMISIPGLFSTCKLLAERAGRTIRSIQGSGQLGTIIKSSLHGVDDYVTQADLQAQQLIVQGLLRKWPDLRVVAEEDSDHSNYKRSANDEYSIVKAKAHLGNLDSVPVEDVTVWVDPLDATREFTKGTHLNCVFCLIGVSIFGIPIAGVMHQPFFEGKGRTISGIVGGAVSGLHLPPHQGQHAGVTVATSPSHHSVKNDQAIKQLSPSEVLRVGGAGYKSSLVMENKVDVYLYNAGGCKLWDTCAPHAIINALGGEMTKVDGSPIVYHTEHLQVPSIIASLRNHNYYISKLAVSPMHK